MTQKRKAELQRKLSMAPVAKPPSGLSDRLKADIPEYLSAQRDRQRLSQSVAFTMRVAASIILLVTSVFLTIQLLSRDERGSFGLAGTETAEPAMAEKSAMESAPEMQSAPAPAADVARETDRRQDAPVRVAEARRLEAPAAAAAPRKKAETKERPPSAGMIGGITGATAEESEAGRASAPAFVAAPAAAQSAARDSVAMNESADVTAATAAPPPPPPAAPITAVSRAEAARSTSTVTRLAPRQRESIFGISTDPTAFGRLNETIVRGEKPEAPAVDVAALVNHFAGPPDETPAEVDLQVEASRIPLSDDGRAVIRYTIDTAIATTAKLTIRVKSPAVDSHRVFGGNVGPVEEVLSPGQSVTGLLEIRARKPIAPATEVATIVLKYRTAGGGQRTLSRNVLVVDLTRTWESASRRHRLATLAAIWGESLQTMKAGAEIAEAAAELALEEPSDTRARELAAAATASSRPRSSSPTGSGR